MVWPSLEMGEKRVSVLLKSSFSPRGSFIVHRQQEGIIFTAFSDTAEYLYECLAERIKDEHGLNTALVTGDSEKLGCVI